MKKFILSTIATIVILPTMAMATQYNTSNTNQSAIYKSDMVSTSQEAMEIGNSYIENLENSNTFELSQKLPTPHLRIDKRSVSLTGTEIKIKEEVNDSGESEFYAEVDVDYNYSYKSKK